MSALGLGVEYFLQLRCAGKFKHAKLIYPEISIVVTFKFGKQNSISKV
jgi:hypothetical protein